MKPETVHIQSQSCPSQTLCGTAWPVRGGRVASDTSPPVVIDERGSVNPANCLTCIAVYQRMLRAKK
jgi:hypothetical protein